MTNHTTSLNFSVLLWFAQCPKGSVYLMYCTSSLFHFSCYPLDVAVAKLTLFKSLLSYFLVYCISYLLYFLFFADVEFGILSFVTIDNGYTTV